MPNCTSSLGRGHSKLPEQGSQTAMVTITVSPASCSQLIPLVVSGDRVGVLYDQIKEKKMRKLCIQMHWFSIYKPKFVWQQCYIPAQE